jgi:Primase C terminal 1 (PriCT-1)/Protein of unknown function (DUF3987)/Bifunctional DNA primase/polymerase, N-terminal
MTKLGPIIPIPEGRKGTNLKNWSTLPLEELARIMANHQGNRGVRLDEIASIDPDTEAAVKLCEQWDKEGKLPETWTYKTARGIVRRMYKRPAGLTGPLHIKEISLQLRTGSGLYDVMPPSRVTDPEKGIDGVYDWLPGLDPESINLADFPQEILCYFQTHAQIPNIGSAQRCRTPSIGNEIPYRERNNTLTSLAGSMRRRGMSQEAIEAALLAENKKCYPELPETEVISIAKSVSRYEPAGTGGTIRAPALLHQGGPHKTAWELAALLFPRVPFPWEVLPFEVAESLQTLARACATSPYSLPGAAFSLLASVLGRAAVVSAKESWDAPMITWFMDLRESGEGKTPGPRLMARVLNEAQNKAEKEYREAMEAYKRLTPKEQKKEQPPPPPRGYFVSDLTLEGLRDDLLNSPLGGIVVIQDEIRRQ